MVWTSRQKGFLAFATALTFSAQAEAPADVADLVGARAAGGETQLEARGYRQISSSVVRGMPWVIWWSERQGQCLTVATMDGRYSAIQRIPDANCRSAALGQPAQRAAGPDEVSLTLVCFGSGAGPTTQWHYGYQYDSRSRRYEPEYGTSVKRESFSSDVQIEISGGRGRIHPQGALVSPIHSGGSDGWWEINDLRITPDRITGNYRMNAFNKPELEIDRRTGMIRITETTSFSGRCDAGNWRGRGF